MLALHLLTAIFAIGPLVHAATTASRGLRAADVGAVRGAERTLTIYSYVSTLVVIFGFGLMSAKAPWNPDEPVAEIADPYIWISTVLWLAAMGLALGLVVPALGQAAQRLGAGESAAGLTARVAAGGGLIGLIFAVIVFLMVYKPGS